MSDKYYVGSDLIASTNNGKYKPISRVTLALDDNNVITAGDDTGSEVYATCPYATQDMADAILSKLRGYTYQAFDADEANLNPSAELGDGITASGIYGVISKLRDDGSGFVSVSAPGEAELEDEYPMDGPIMQMIQREIKKVGSSITKTADEIRLEIWGDGGKQETSIIAQLGSIVSEVEEAIGTDKETGELLSVSSMISQTATEISATVTALDREINGYTPGEGEEGDEIVGIKQTVSSLVLNQEGFETSVKGAIGTNKEGDLITVESSITAALDGIALSAEDKDGITTIKLTGAGLEAKSAEINLKGFVTFTGLKEGTTTIDGGCIKTGTISADRIAVEKIKIGDLENDAEYQDTDGVTSIIKDTITTGYVNALGVTAANMSGELISLKLPVWDDYYEKMVDQEIARFALTYTTSGSGMVIKTMLGGLKLESSGNIQLAPAPGGYTALGGVFVSCQADLQPSSGTYTCGTEAVGWADVYACDTSLSEIIKHMGELEERIDELEKA